MTSPSCLIDLKNVLPKSSWSQVIAALRHDAVIWNVLQNPDFRGLAISKLGSHPEKWSPARLAILSLKLDLNLKDLRNTPLSEIDPELRLRAIQTYELQASDSPPEMDLDTAGLLMLALLEHYRLTKSWEKIPHNNHWKTAYAGLYGCLEHPSAFLIALPPTLITQVVLANPLSTEEQTQVFTTILVSSPQQTRLTILRDLASQRPVLAQNLAYMMLKAPQTSNHTPSIPADLLADLWPQFEELHALTTIINNSLTQAEIQFGAGYGEQATEALQTTLDTAGHLQRLLTTQTAQINISLGKIKESQDIWQAAQNPLILPTENIAALALELIEKGTIEQARALLVDHGEETHPLVLLAKARMAILQWDLEAARQAANQSYSDFSRLSTHQKLKLAKLLLELKLAHKATHILDELQFLQFHNIYAAHLAALAYAAIGAYPQAIQAIHLVTALEPEQLQYQRDFARIHELYGQWPAALEARQAVVENSPELQIEDLQSLAKCEIQLEKFEQAQDTCHTALKLAPDDGMCLAILGEALFHKGQKKKALEHLQKAIQSAPDLGTPWLILASIQKQNGEFAKATETLRQASQAVSDQAEIQLALGETHLQAGAISQALSCLQRANQMAESYPVIEYFHLRSQIGLPLAKALFELGHAEEALQTIQSITSLPDKQTYLLHLQAQILIFLGRAQEALPLLAKALLIDPEDIYLGLDYARALIEAGNASQKAIDTLNALLERDSDNPEALALLAEAFSSIDEPAEALKVYRKALNTCLSEDPRWYARLSVGLARSALALEQPETALAVLQQVSQNAPQDLPVLQTMAEAYAVTQLNEQARQTAILARDLAPSSVENLSWYAHLSANIQAYDEAANALNKAIEINPQQVDHYLRLGEIHQHVGDLKSAHQVFRQVAELDQATPIELHSAAKNLIVLQQPQDAVDCLQIAVQRCQAENQDKYCIELLSDLIEAYQQLDQAEQALATLVEFSGRHPENLDLIGRRVILLQQMGRDDEAINTVQQILFDNPSSQYLHLVAAKTYYAQGNLIKAREYSQKAIDLACDGNSAISVQVWAADIADACLQTVKSREILALTLDQVEQTESLEYQCLRSELALQVDEEIDAAQSLTIALGLSPEHPRVLALQARLTARHGNVRNAQQIFQNALSTWDRLPKREIVSPVGYLALSQAALELHQWSTAIYLLQEAVEAFPYEPRTNLQLARGLVLRAEHQRMCETLKVERHAPGKAAISDFAHNSFEKCILAATQSNTAISNTPQSEISHWRLRGQAIFQPSAEHAQALGNFPQTNESRAAYLAVLRHSREKSTSQRTALEYFVETSQSNRSDSFSIPIMVQIALALNKLNPQQAQEAAQKALDASIRQHHPALPLFYALQAFVAEGSGDVPAMIQALQSALERWPDEPEWHIWMAEALQKLPTPQKETEIYHLSKAVELNPKNGSHQYRLGKAYLEANDQQNAISVLEQATRLTPKQPAPWLALAQAYQASGEISQTFRNAEHASELDPRNIEPKLLLAKTAFEIGNPQKSLQYCQEGLQIDPRHPEILLWHARALDTTGRTTEALQAFNQALERGSKSIPLMLEHAQLTRRVEGNQPAIKALNQLVAEYPDDPRVLALLAEMMIENDETDPAVEVAQKALHTNQGDLDCTQEAHVLILLGRLMHRNGQLDHSINYLSEAIQCDPESVEAYLELGRAYHDRRQYAQALDAFHQAIAIAPAEYQAYYQAGQTYKTIKDYAAAEDMLKRAAKLAPNDLAVRRQLGGLVALNLVHNRKEDADLYVD